MMGLARRRRENERKKNLDEIFNKADVSGNGKITPQAFKKVFQAAEIPITEHDISKITDSNGEIKMADFMKFALTTDLGKVEFVDRVFHKAEVDHEEEAEKKKKNTKKVEKSKEGGSSSTSTKMDKIEYAFRKFDINGDGYLSRDEFDLMMKSVEKSEADRIFKSCDSKKDGRISLEEFRAMLARDKEKK